MSAAKLLEWDTRFFGVRVAKVVGNALDEETAPQLLEWCDQERVDCLYFLADAASEASISAAEKHGFGLKDVRLTYQRRLEPSLADAIAEWPAGVVIRSARPDDASALEAVAETGFTDSRFYFDRRFPRPAVDELYRTWIRQSLAGPADTVLVLENVGRPAGFVTCRLLDERTGECKLVGVESSLRGRGLGRQMVEAALRWFAGQGVELVVVVTQARNIRAQRLYQRVGFLLHRAQFWYHKWFERDAAPAGVGRAA